MSAAHLRQNIYDYILQPEVAHGGRGKIFATRIINGPDSEAVCDFVDYVEVPAGSSIGDHRHSMNQEEYYLVLDGSGEMHLEREQFTVRTGDLIRNPPGGLHGLVNTGESSIKLFIFQFPVSYQGSD